MLERFAQAAAFDQFAQAIGFRGRQGAVEVEIQLHARHFEQMREQQFRLQARRLDIFFGEEFRAFLNRFEDRHAHRLNRRCQPRQPDVWRRLRQGVS